MNAVALRKRKISMEITQQHGRERERERENGKCIMSYFPHHGCATTFDESTAYI